MLYMCLWYISSGFCSYNTSCQLQRVRTGLAHYFTFKVHVSEQYISVSVIISYCFVQQMKFDPEGNVTSFGEFNDSPMTRKCNRRFIENEEQCVLSYCVISLFPQRKRKQSFIRNLDYRQETWDSNILRASLHEIMQSSFAWRYI